MSLPGRWLLDVNLCKGLSFSCLVHFPIFHICLDEVQDFDILNIFIHLLLFSCYRDFFDMFSLVFFRAFQVSSTLQNILADFICAVVWVVLMIPLISCSPSFFSKFWNMARKAQITNGITINFMIHNFFTYFTRYFSSFRLLFLPTCLLKRQHPLNYFLFYSRQLKLSLVFWYWLGDPLYLRVREYFCLIFFDRYSLVDIPFVNMIKLSSLAYIPWGSYILPSHDCWSILFMLFCRMLLIIWITTSFL